MADRIKGITVEIGGDTTNLSESLKHINAESRQIGTELSDVNRLLRFNPESTELLAQRQQLLSRQIENTTTRLNHLRSVEGQVQAQFERGDLGEQQFRAFQREIIASEGRLQHFEEQARTSSRNISGAFAHLGEGIKGAIGAAVAGEGLQEVVTQSLEAAHLQTQIKVGFDVPPESAAAIQNAVNSIKAYGVDGEEALAAVRRQWALNGDQSDAVNAKIIQDAGMIATTYEGIDLNELIQETSEVAKGLGISNEQALGMENSLLKMGFPPDQLDIIAEYGQALSRAGYSAKDIQGIFAAGIKTGSWNIDVLLDGLKEGRIRLSEFGQGVNKSTSQLLQGTNISAAQLQSWGKAVAAGGDAGKQAMSDVGKALMGINDQTKQNALGVAIFGTQWEENGSKVAQALAGASAQAGNLDTDVKQLGTDTNTLNADPTVQLSTAFTQMQTALTPLLVTIAQYVGMVATWISQNPQLSATIAAVAIGIGILIGILAAASTVIGFLTTMVGLLEVELLPLIIGFLGVIAVIGLLIAAGIAIYQNWDHIKAKASELVANIKVQWEAFKAATETKFNAAKEKIVSIWNSVMSFFSGINLSKIGHDVMQGFLNGISGMAGAIWKKAEDIANGVGNWLKKALKTGSPSKLTYGIGLDTGEGLKLGLEASTDRVNSASNKMAAAAVPNTAPTVQNQTVGGNNMTVNINSPKALDVREANRAFNQSLQRIALLW